MAKVFDFVVMPGCYFQIATTCDIVYGYIKNNSKEPYKVTIETLPTATTSIDVLYIDDTVDCTDDLPDDDCAALHQRHKDFFR